MSFLVWWLMVYCFSFFLTPLPIVKCDGALIVLHCLHPEVTLRILDGGNKPWTSQYYISKTCAYNNLSFLLLQ